MKIIDSLNISDDDFDKILEWKEKAKLHWRGAPQKEIIERIALREKLSA